MAVPTVRYQFKEYCLRKLGKPVIEINVTDEQVDDRVDEALKLFWDYHYDGAEKVYFKHQIDANTISNGYITIPEEIISVTNIFDLGNFSTSANYLFDITYHVALDTVFQLSQGGGIADYYVTRTKYAQIQEVLVGKPFIRFNRHSDKLHLDISSGKLVEGYWLIVEGYRKFDPAEFVYTIPSITRVSGNTEISGAFTTIPEEGTHVSGNGIPANTYIESANSTVAVLTNAPTASGTSTLTFEPESDVWADQWLSQYAALLIKYQWGSNITKFKNLVLPGGVQFDGEKILDDAEKEIEVMREKLINGFSLPVSDMVG